jgi:hypothetical protein
VYYETVRMGMRMMSLKRLAIGASVALAAFTGNAFAAKTTLEMTWSGEAFGNDARAVGFFTFDDPTLPNIDHESAIPVSELSDLVLTITGASSGNGTFRKSDFSALYFMSPSSLDLSKPLVGQALTDGSSFGPLDSHPGTGNRGDFNLLGATDNAPVGTFVFTLTSDGGHGDSLLLTALTPAIPEPDTALLMLAASGIVAGAMVRKRKAGNAR